MICSHACMKPDQSAQTSLYKGLSMLHHTTPYGLMGDMIYWGGCPYSQEVGDLSNVANYRECLAYWDN